MVIGIYLLFLLILLMRVVKKESIIAVCLCALTILPSYNGIEGTNIVLVATFLLAILCLCFRKHVCVNKEIVIYVLAYTLIVTIQFISWLIHNPYNTKVELITSFSVIKYPIMILSLYIYEQGIDKKKDYDTLVNAIGFINVVNLGVCVVQKLYGSKVIPYFIKWYDYSTFHITELSQARRYYRAYGTWDSPMSLGLYALFTLAVLLYIMHRKKANWWILLNICMCFVLGILSLTKSFFLGILVLVILELFLMVARRIKEAYVSIKIIRKGLLVVTAVALAIVAFINIYDWSAGGWPQLHYYLGYVLHPLDALDSRLSSTGSLSETLDIISNNFILGVGSIPVGGELIGDNVYVVILHAGGILSLLVYLYVYVRWISKSISAQKYDLLIVIILFLLSGLSLPIGWNYKVCMIPCVLYLLFESEINYEENYHDCKASGCRRG